MDGDARSLSPSASRIAVQAGPLHGRGRLNGGGVERLLPLELG